MPAPQGDDHSPTGEKTCRTSEILSKLRMAGEDMFKGLCDLLSRRLDAQQSLGSSFRICPFEIQVLDKATLAEQLPVKTLELRRQRTRGKGKTRDIGKADLFHRPAGVRWRRRLQHEP